MNIIIVTIIASIAMYIYKYMQECNKLNMRS